MGIRFFFSMIGFSDDLWGRLKPYLCPLPSFIRMRRKTSPFTAEISGEDCEAVLKTFNFSQAYFAAQYIAE